MSARTSLPSLLESFFRHRMMKQRNASEATIASYRDGLRLLILFAAEHTQRKPSALTVADLDRDLVLAFLDDLETKRQNAVQTRNMRLAAIRSFFRHVAENDPASLGIAQRILAIPLKKTHTEVTPHLTRREFDALSTRRTSERHADDVIGACCFFSGEPVRVSPRRSASTCAIFTSIRRGRRCSCAARAARSA